MNKAKFIFISAIFLLLSCSPETKLFDKAKELNTVEGYENYLSKYKDGEYVDEAQQKIH